MSPITKTMTAFLGVIAVAAVAIAVVLTMQFLDDGVDQERQQAKRYFMQEYEYYCTFAGVVPGPPLESLSDPRYKKCLADQAKQDLQEWEDQGRPPVQDIDSGP